MRLYLGNAAVLQPKQTLDDGTQPEPDRRSDLDGNPTVVDHADGTPLLDILTNVRSLWSLHSNMPPAWVAAENPTVAEALSAQFAGVPVRDFSEAEGHYHSASGLQPPREAAAAPEQPQEPLPQVVEAPQSTTMADVAVAAPQEG